MHSKLYCVCTPTPHSYDEKSNTMDSDFPRTIESDFPGIGREVDAVVYYYGKRDGLSSGVWTPS